MSMPTIEEIRAYDGDDIHRWLASRVIGKTESEITEEQRATVKKDFFAFAYSGGPWGL